jgi:hypothetical protein
MIEIPHALKEAIREGRAVLFLGAGASMGAKSNNGSSPPNGLQLTKILSDRFLGGQDSENPLLSLLAAELSHLCEEKSENSGRFNLKDREMARLARDILFHEFRNPPSVEVLSKRVGTNQFKLKNCFTIFLITRLMAYCWKSK